VLRAFLPFEKMRSTPGVGLASICVAAIVKLHAFRLVIHSGPGGRRNLLPGSAPNSRAPATKTQVEFDRQTRRMNPF